MQGIDFLQAAQQALEQHMLWRTLELDAKGVGLDPKWVGPARLKHKLPITCINLNHPGSYTLQIGQNLDGGLPDFPT